MTPEVQAERDRCAAILEAVAQNWERSAAEARKEGTFTVRALWPLFKLTDVGRPGYERAARNLEDCAATLRIIKRHVESGLEPPRPVDIRRAGACQGESSEPMAQSCAMVPAVESQQTLKK